MCTIFHDEFMSALELEQLCGPAAPIEINTSNVNRPGLQFADFFEQFAEETAFRLQIIGVMEMRYLETLSSPVRRKRLERYFSYPLPCVIISRSLEPLAELTAAAARHNRPLFRSSLVTTFLVHRVYDYLNAKLAPRTTEHAVLMDVYGMGILLLGESGIGKSETALELIKRGHRLVSDDIVDIKKVADHRLIGEAPEATRHYLAIRGIGIIDVKAMYGIGSVLDNKPIDLIIRLEYWDKNTEYEQLGLEEQYMTILDTPIPYLVIPVKPGRNLAVIIEAATRNFRLQRQGSNAAAELDRRVQEAMSLR